MPRDAAGPAFSPSEDRTWLERRTEQAAPDDVVARLEALFDRPHEHRGIFDRRDHPLGGRAGSKRFLNGPVDLGMAAVSGARRASARSNQQERERQEQT